MRNQHIAKNDADPLMIQALAEIEWPSSGLTGAHMMQPMIGPPTEFVAGDYIVHYAYKWGAAGTLDFQALTGRVPAFWIVRLV